LGCIVCVFLQVSYFSTCSCLSDRQKFPSFFRTIPSDAFQVRAIIQILKYFGWTWAGLLISDNDYGLHAARSFQSDLARLLAAQVARQDVTGLQWIASEAWTSSTTLQTPHLMPYLGGTLGIAIRRGEIPGLREFMLQIRPDPQDKSSGNNMGEISNKTDSMECTTCPEDFWSSPQRDHCVPKKTEFLSYHEPLGICLTTASLLGTLICAVVLGIFIYHRSTPIVRANNSELSFQLLFSLKLCFLCSLLFIGHPRLWTLFSTGFKQAQAMAFAIDEINRNSNLLPNMTLGYSVYDNCLQLGIGFRGALSLASGQEERVTLHETCVGTPPVLGIVGDDASSHSIAISTVLGLYRVPMVRAMVQILKHFGWTWAGLLISDDDYGLGAAQSFQSDLGPSGGGCLAYTEILSWGDNPAELRRIVNVMKKSTARVVIAFVHESHMIDLMEELVYYLEKVNFTTSFGDQVSFDENGDVLPIYDILNWQGLPDGRVKVQTVGEVKKSPFRGEELTLDEDEIFWNFESKESLSSLPATGSCYDSDSKTLWLDWAGLLISDDDYGLHAARSFHTDLGPSGGGCLAYTEILPWGDNPAELRRIVNLMKKSTARVVIVFAHESHMIDLMKEVVRQNVTGLQWMASEAWTAASVLQTPRLMPYLGGTLGIAIRRGEIPGLREFMSQIHPDPYHNKSQGNNVVNQFWEYTFKCKFAPAPAGWVEAGGTLCTGQEDLESVETDYFDISNLRSEYNVYKAVYALAYALDNMLQCEPGRGPFSGNSCGNLQQLEPWQPPRSVCSESCPPGTRKARKKGQPECCFDCIPCSEGEISNKT
ncbi:hypothetical protein INR49_016566, partial [Caranx melampygus]